MAWMYPHGHLHLTHVGQLTLTKPWKSTPIDSRVARSAASLVQRRFLSLEPLLGPLPSLDLAGIDWVIVGGESGPGFRPLDLNWVRDLRDRCIRLRIPLFFKQVGGRNPKAGGRELDGRTWDQFPVPVRVEAVAHGG
jgi:protein gp37